MSGFALSRRGLLAGGLAAALLPAGRARAAVPRTVSRAAVPRTAVPRTAVIDWALLESLLALGLTPVAAAELRLYRRLVVEPALPPGVVDLGLRGSPNFELLSLCRPELVLSSPWYEGYRGRLERVAPVESLSIYQPGRSPWEPAVAALLELGGLLGARGQAERYLERLEPGLAQRSRVLAPFAERPFFLINLGDARHFRAFGRDSLFGATLARLGLANAWSDDTRYRAQAQIQLEALARVPEARLVIVGPLPEAARRSLPQSGLWNALPAVREGRVTLLPPVSPFGGLPSALRFARLLAEGLSRPGGLPRPGGLRG